MRKTSPASRGLVTNKSTVPPRKSSTLRSATETDEPTTTWRSVVSVVSRDSTSPTRAVSKKDGLSASNRSKTARRRSATTRSPIQATR